MLIYVEDGYRTPSRQRKVPLTHNQLNQHNNTKQTGQRILKPARGKEQVTKADVLE